jgi:hypothetical protein
MPPPAAAMAMVIVCHRRRRSQQHNHNDDRPPQERNETIMTSCGHDDVLSKIMFVWHRSQCLKGELNDVE